MKRKNNTYKICIGTDDKIFVKPKQFDRSSCLKTSNFKKSHHRSYKYVESNIDELTDALFNAGHEPHAFVIKEFLNKLEILFLRLKRLPTNCLTHETIQLKISGYNTILCDLKYLIRLCSQIHRHNYDQIDHQIEIQETCKQIIKLCAEVTYELEKTLYIQHKSIKKHHMPNLYTCQTTLDFFCDKLHRILNEIRENQPCSIERLFETLRQKISIYCK